MRKKEINFRKRFCMPRMKGFKGIEGMPFKYLLIILVAMIIITAFLVVMNHFSTTALSMTQSTNSTLHDVLNTSLSRALK